MEEKLTKTEILERIARYREERNKIDGVPQREVDLQSFFPELSAPESAALQLAIDNFGGNRSTEAAFWNDCVSIFGRRFTNK